MRLAKLSFVALALLATPFFFVQADETPAPAEVVEFEIAAGTGSKPWNTMDKPARVKVGQILRLVNKDSVAHQLHTPGIPCPHGSRAFGPGQTYDCVISAPAKIETQIYDHIAGPRARFYVEATH